MKYTADDSVLVGVECEFERARHVEYIPGWETMEEGSLHNGGIEFVFDGPQKGEGVVKRLHQLERAYRAVPPLLSRDAGLHVHIDVHELTRDEKCKVITTALMLEPLLMRTFCPERLKTNFCQTVDSNKALMRQVRSAIRQVRVMNTARLDCRYAATNLSSISKHGSIEFRGHGPEWRAAPILKWINMLLCVRKYALTIDDYLFPEEPLLSLSTRGTLNKVFGKYGADIRAGSVSRRALRDGIKSVQTMRLPSLHRREEFNQRESARLPQDVTPEAIDEATFTPTMRRTAFWETTPSPYTSISTVPDEGDI